MRPAWSCAEYQGSSVSFVNMTAFDERKIMYKSASGRCKALIGVKWDWSLLIEPL